MNKISFLKSHVDALYNSFQENFFKKLTNIEQQVMTLGLAAIAYLATIYLIHRLCLTRKVVPAEQPQPKAAVPNVQNNDKPKVDTPKDQPQVLEQMKNSVKNQLDQTKLDQPKADEVEPETVEQTKGDKPEEELEYEKLKRPSRLSKEELEEAGRAKEEIVEAIGEGEPDEVEEDTDLFAEANELKLNDEDPKDNQIVKTNEEITQLNESEADSELFEEEGDLGNSSSSEHEQKELEQPQSQVVLAADQQKTQLEVTTSEKKQKKQQKDIHTERESVNKKKESDKSQEQEIKKAEDKVKVKEEQPKVDAEKVEEEQPKIDAEKVEEVQPKVDGEKVEEGQPKADAEKVEEEQPKVDAEKVEEEQPKADAEKVEEEQPKVDAEKVEEEQPKADAEKVEEEQPKIDAEKVEEEQPKVDAEKAKKEEPVEDDEIEPESTATTTNESKDTEKADTSLLSLISSPKQTKQVSMRIPTVPLSPTPNLPPDFADAVRQSPGLEASKKDIRRTLVGGVSVFPSPSKQTSTQLIQAGLRLYSTDPDQASLKIGQALEKDPKNYRIYELVGDAKKDGKAPVQGNKYVDAVGMYSQAIELAIEAKKDQKIIDAIQRKKEALMVIIDSMASSNLAQQQEKEEKEVSDSITQPNPPKKAEDKATPVDALQIFHIMRAVRTGRMPFFCALPPSTVSRQLFKSEVTKEVPQGSLID